MPDLAIKVEQISKRYALGEGYGYKTLRESLVRLALPRSARTSSRREIWALRDVSFEIATGEVVGVIGPNGAGKTTILKILSRITRPTAGWAETEGRVGSLLEVGTGFHPELTGRENVYLSGAILGMRRAEIGRRFDEIVTFADIEGFLDTPIKRYSSGMKVRLAFAVAAHLEPEILIVDEVLAVGDLAFQRKCLGKMGDVTSEGRTVLFVSHNMSLVRALCRRGILLAGGSIVTDAPIDDAVAAYLQTLESAESENLAHRLDRRGWNEAMLERVEVLAGPEGGLRLSTGGPASFVFHLNGSVSRMSCTFTIFNNLGLPVATLSSAPGAGVDVEIAGSRARFECIVEELLLVPGRYRIDATVHGRGHLQDHLEGVAFFDVEEGPVRGRPLPEKSEGDVTMPHRWRLPGPS